MVIEIKQNKKEMKCEYPKGKINQGSACWPLWVPEVCCGLLVNGTRPSAVPTNIGILYETLYGEEPREFPSMWFV